METRQCIRCKETFPATTEYFWKAGKGKLNIYCKTCATKIDRKNKGYPEKHRRDEQIGDPRICTKCGRTYPATSEYFQPQKGCTNGLRPDCRECVAKIRHKYFDENRDSFREYNREWYRKNIEYARKSQRTYSQKYKEKTRARGREWARNNPEKKKLAHYRYIARKKSLDYTLADDDWQFALEYWGNCCAVCGDPATLFKQIVPDHWVPIFKGGGTTPDNIVPLCHPKKVRGAGSSCNTTKNFRDPEEWILDQLGKHKGKQKLKEINVYFEIVRNRKKGDETDEELQEFADAGIEPVQIEGDSDD